MEMRRPFELDIDNFDTDPRTFVDDVCRKARQRPAVASVFAET
jgi:hypothetical protein